MALASGTRLGPYEILGSIGVGGMGEVYRAQDTRLGRDVAIKVLPQDTAQIPDRLARFEREARAVAALNHPNILALHDVGNESGIVYVVMELLEGETLRERLLTGRLTPLKAINYATQIARGLAAAHERGIVHRDLKPENLFVTSDGRVKILDFGIAQRGAESRDGEVGRTTRLTTDPGTILGTPDYMSPEQVLGQPATPRSDLFAFGVVVFEMLTGAHPFKRKTTGDTVAAIVREDPPSMSGVLVDLPAGVGGILQSCLDKQATDRPTSARDIALFLEAAGTTRERDAWRLAVPSDVRRVRNRIVAVVCGLLILLSATTWMLVRTMADRAVASAIDADLARAGRLMLRVQRERLNALALTARLVASFPELRALFATDAPTIRDYLLFYQQRNPGTPLLIAIGADGTVVAHTDDTAFATADGEWVAGLVQRSGEPAVVEILGRPFHAAAAVADAGGTVFGYVVAAMSVGDEFAASIREATQDEIVILSDTGVLASTLRGQAPWRSRTEWRQTGGSTERATDVLVAGQRFAAREMQLAERPAISGIVLKSRNEVTAPFRSMETVVIVVGLLGVAVAAAGSLWIARLLSPAETLQNQRR